MSLNNIMVWYKADVESKSALRLAGHVAEKFGSTMNIVTLYDDIMEAKKNVNVAAQYLKSFKLDDLKKFPLQPATNSLERIKQTAFDNDTDLLIMGNYRNGLFRNWFKSNMESEVALSPSLPVLLAR